MQAQQDKLERKRIERERKQAQREVCIGWSIRSFSYDSHDNNYWIIHLKYLLKIICSGQTGTENESSS